MAYEQVEVRQESVASLRDYFMVPISFMVRSRFLVGRRDGTLGGYALSEEAVEPAYLKDYDEGERRERWLKFGSLDNWGFWGAFVDAERVGGAVVAHDTPNVHMLKGRRDLAVLWDLRVRPDRRGQGVGKLLLEAALAWSRSRGCTQLDVETQNNNVPACRFYESRGCELTEANPKAYPEHPDETQLIWSLAIA